jgi:5-methylcytosine-specific restriction endonuclease McrA
MMSFRHKADIRNGDQTWELVYAHGAFGYGIWWAVVEDLYKAGANNFAITASPAWLKSFSKGLNIDDPRLLLDVVETMAKLDLISKEQWAEQTIYSREVEEDAVTRKRVATQYHKYQKHQAQVFQRDSFKCVYCGSVKGLSLDHVVPQSLGGSHDIDNLATCCIPCNCSKGAKTLSEWRGRVYD